MYLLMWFQAGLCNCGFSKSGLSYEKLTLSLNHLFLFCKWYAVVSSWHLLLLLLSHFSRVQLCVTLWTVACQASRSMGFSREEYWSGQPCLPSGDLPDSGMEPRSLKSPALAGEFFTTSTTWEAPVSVTYSSLNILCWFMFPLESSSSS